MAMSVGNANVNPRTATDAATVDVTRVFSPVLVLKTAGPPQLERMNARTLTPEQLPEEARRFGLVTVDVSFISLRQILPVIPPRR